MNDAQKQALAQARADVKAHWAFLLNSTPERVQEVLDDTSGEFASLQALFNSAVLDVLGQVYGTGTSKIQ